MNSPGSVEDPSLVALASRSLMLGQSEGGLLSYKATSGLITSSNSCIFNWDNNLHLLELLKVYILFRKRKHFSSHSHCKVLEFKYISPRVLTFILEREGKGKLAV